eukprot:jgi/Mesen1/6226/ME000320S05418
MHVLMMLVHLQSLPLKRNWQIGANFVALTLSVYNPCLRKRFPAVHRLASIPPYLLPTRRYHSGAREAATCFKISCTFDMAPVARMAGTLIRWGGGSKVAFQSGTSKKHVIVLGGLTDGFFATRYVPPLAEALVKNGWSLVQTLLSSSYIGYGIASLDQDAEEMEELINYLVTEEHSEGVVLVGHSTGCQDIVHYMKRDMEHSKAVLGAVLQAPVSDREFLATLPESAGGLEVAEKMIQEGKGEELMPRHVNPHAPITALRYYSLGGKGGLDDLFSSDFSDEELESKLRHMSNVACQVIFSMEDEFVPDSVNKEHLAKRLAAALGTTDLVELDGDHALSKCLEEAVTCMVNFITKLNSSKL